MAGEDPAIRPVHPPVTALKKDSVPSERKPRSSDAEAHPLWLAGSPEELKEEAWWWSGGEGGVGEDGATMEKGGCSDGTGCVGRRTL